MRCTTPRHALDDPPDGFIYLLCLKLGIQMLPPHYRDLGMPTIVRTQESVSGFDVTWHVLGCEFRKCLGRNIFFHDFCLDVLKC